VFDIFDEDNTIRLKGNTNLCLTVAKEESRKGGGGSPVHLIRKRIHNKNVHTRTIQYKIIKN
jgi:hypothetical protein